MDFNEQNRGEAAESKEASKFSENQAYEERITPEQEDIKIQAEGNFPPPPPQPVEKPADFSQGGAYYPSQSGFEGQTQQNYNAAPPANTTYGGNNPPSVFEGQPQYYGTDGVQYSPVYPPGYGRYPFNPILARRQYEKSIIRRASHPIAISLLLLMGLTIFWSIIIIAVAGALGYPVDKVYELMSDPAVMSALNVVISFFGFVVAFLVMAKLFRYKIKEIVAAKKPEKGLGLPMFLMGVAFCSYANVAISQIMAIFKSIGIDFSADLMESPPGLFGFLLSIVAVSFAPALIEEFAFRGVSLGILKKYGEGFAIMTTAILFGLVHGNFMQIPFAFLIGLALGFIVLKTGSIWIACAVHAVNNFISVFFDYVMSRFPEVTQNICYNIYLVAILLLGIIGILMLRKRKDVFRLNKGELEASTGQKLKWFFSSPMVVIYTVFTLLEAVLIFVVY